MSEIMQDKSVSIATVLNWVINLFVSFFTKQLIDSFGVGYIFLGSGVLTFCGSIFIFIFMIETKGKTRDEILQLFTKSS